MLDRILGKSSHSSSSSTGTTPPPATGTAADPSPAYRDDTLGPLRRRRPAPAEAARDASLTERLLPQGPDLPAAPQSSRRDPVDAASGPDRRGAAGMLRSLLSREPPSVPAQAFHAATAGDAKTLQALLQQDPGLATAVYKRQDTLLTWSAWLGQQQSVLAVLHHAKHAAPDRFAGYVNHRDSWGRTALAHAAAERRPALAKLLLQHTEVDVNIADNESLTPLHHAARHGDLETTARLLARPGILPSLPDGAGDTPLHTAIREGHEALAIRLAAHDETLPDQANRAHQTPLTTAIAYDRVDTVDELLRNLKVDPNRARPGSPRPIWQVLLRWRERPMYNSDRPSEAAQMLCSFIASSRVESNCHGLGGETPLTFICKQGPRWDLAEPRLHVMWQATTLRALLAAGRREGSRLDPATRNSAGKTALQVAQGISTTLADILREDQDLRRRQATPSGPQHRP